MKWHSDFNTGITDIDKQHQRLFQLVESFDNNSISLLDTIKSLIDYIELHFKFEENLMEQTNYIDLSQHRKEHSYFVKKVLSYEKDIRKKTIDKKIVMEFLNKWIINHILQTDKKMAYEIKEKLNKFN